MVVQGDKQMARTTKQTKTPAPPSRKYELWAQGLEGDYVRLAAPISH